MQKRSRLFVALAVGASAAALSVGQTSAGSFNFNAHDYDSDRCNGNNCPLSPAGQPTGTGEANPLNGDSPEQGAELLTSVVDGYGGLNFDVPHSNFTFSDLAQLQTDYEVSWGTCKGGAPRWQINVLPPGTPINGQTIQNAKNIFVYFGSVPTSGTQACPEADGSEVNTGNYIGSSLTGGDTPGRYDTSQLASGTQVSTYTATETSFGSYEVVGIQLVDDSGWSQSQSQYELQVVVDQVQVNGTTSYPDKDQNGEDPS